MTRNCQRGEIFMQGSERSKLLVGAMLALLTGGCATSGREQSSRSAGPSPSFGLNYVPQQTEPPVESVAESGKSKSRTVATPKPATADLDSPTDDPSGKNGIKLVNWMSNRDKEPAPRKPLPLSSSTPVASDDERFEQ
jgi:hypothetical protein